MLMFSSALRELLDVLPVTLLISCILFGMLAALRYIRRKKKPSLIMLLFTSFYLSLLLYGTCLSRMESIADFLDFSRWGKGLFVFNIWPSGDFSFHNTSVIHGLYNLLLFLPWGILGMLYFPRPIGIAISTISAVVMSTLVEAFQRSHGMGFVIADITFNTIGGFLGALAMYLFLFIRQSRKGQRTL